MKKIIIFISFVLLGLVASSQVLTKTAVTGAFGNGATYFYKAGAAVDTLTSNQDSIQMQVNLYPANGLGIDKIYKFTYGAQFAKRSGSDTLVIVTMYGRNFDSESWTRITSTHTANVTTATTYISAAYGTAVMYRQLRMNIQLVGMKSTGVKLNFWEFKVWYQ